MKCPWRTITKTEKLYTKEVNVTCLDFMDCLKSECPYYGVAALKHRNTGGWETVIEPKCRRCEVQNE